VASRRDQLGIQGKPAIGPDGHREIFAGPTLEAWMPTQGDRHRLGGRDRRLEPQ